MVQDAATNTLIPFNFDNILKHVPELERFDYQIDTITFDPLLDSSNVSVTTWIKLADIIEEHYHLYDGFIILHGTDTMAYSASALSFMLCNLDKPVIFTGSQLPLGLIRTDGKENLITAIEIAAAKLKNKAIVPEVCIYFENLLIRGNRSTKYSADHFNAFHSPNCLPLAEAGVNIKYNHNLILSPTVRMNLEVRKEFNSNIAVIKLYPSITEKLVKSIFGTSDLRAVIIESFGNGNSPTEIWLIDEIKNFINNGGIILNTSQCYAGSVEMGVYETSRQLQAAGVISAYDMTLESAIAKLMFLLGNYKDMEMIVALLKKSLRGEISI